MAHEITKSDHLVLTGHGAWHGLGTVVESAPTPQEALQQARLNWTVEQWPLQAECPTGVRAIDSHVLNVRSDTHGSLGVVGVGYRPVQNAELAEFVSALGSTGPVKIESAGSIRSGKRVWFLARGESIWVSNSDEVKPYLLVANAHDGTLSVVCQPTTIRVVCKNTLHASLRQGERSALTVRFRHEGIIADKLDDARRALGIFTAAREQFARQAEYLQGKAMNREELQRFWLDVYAATMEPIPAHPTTQQEERAVRQAQQRLAQWASNFDQDRARVHGPASAWTALNAVTKWFDHERPVRAPSEGARHDSRIYNNLWGESSLAKVKAMELALSR
jgi:phage/plasmid-like protein (TIGR03299 family)